MQVKLLPNRLFDYGHVVFINDIKLIKFKCVIAFSRVFGFYFVERFFSVRLKQTFVTSNAAVIRALFGCGRS